MRNEAIQSLSTNPSRIGVTVAAGSPVTLQASLEQPNYAYFAKAELPKLLTRTMGQAAGTLGVSTVALSGIR